MAKYFGKIGYVESVEVERGVFEERPIEREYRGEILRNTRRWENSEHLNDNLNVNNLFSIVSDAYANDHFFAMRYIWWQGVRWEITNVEVQRPRLILTIGGVYNGPTVESTETSDDVGDGSEK